MAEQRLRLVTALRIERGRKGEADDIERGLLADDGVDLPLGWAETPIPPPDSFVHEHGHILADQEHVLLQDQVRSDADGVTVVSTLRMEGHPLRQVGDRLERGGRASRAVAWFSGGVVKQTHEVTDIFSDPVARRRFAHAVRHPDQLTPRQQRALLFLLLVTSFWGWVVGLGVLALLSPGFAVPWNVLFTLYFAAVGTNLFLPVPMEPIALAGAVVVGSSAAALAAGAGKAVGAWIIFSLGSSLRRGVERLQDRSRLTTRLLVSSERFARRFGYLALGLMLAVPFSPFDIVPVYLFSTLGLRLGPFLAAVFVGFTLRLLLVIVLGQRLFGLG